MESWVGADTLFLSALSGPFRFVTWGHACRRCIYGFYVCFLLPSFSLGLFHRPGCVPGGVPLLHSPPLCCLEVGASCHMANESICLLCSALTSRWEVGVLHCLGVGLCCHHVQVYLCLHGTDAPLWVFCQRRHDLDAWIYHHLVGRNFCDFVWSGGCYP